MTQNETFLSGKMPGMVDAHVLAVQVPSWDHPAGNLPGSKGTPRNFSPIGSPGRRRGIAFRQTTLPPPPCLGVPQSDQRQLRLTNLRLHRRGRELRACGCLELWCICMSVNLNLNQFGCPVLPCVS